MVAFARESSESQSLHECMSRLIALHKLPFYCPMFDQMCAAIKMFPASVWILLSLSLPALGQQCYCKDNGSINECGAGPKPCGAPNADGFVQCCASGDTCGADGFCHFIHPQGSTSGFYLGGCTDPNFADSSCPQLCSKY